MPPLTSPNFGFLAAHDPLLVALGAQAERYFADDPVTCLIKLRQFGEALTKRLAQVTGVLIAGLDQSQVIHVLTDRRLLPLDVKQLLHDLRRVGNVAAHESRGTHAEALHQLKMARQLGAWFHRVVGKAKGFAPGPFVPPPDPAEESKALAGELERLRQQLAAAALSVEQANAARAEEERRRLSVEERAKQDAEERAIWEQLAAEAEAKLAAQLAAAAAAPSPPPATVQAFEQAAEKAAAKLDLDEADTRRLVDQQLRAAGWEADSVELRYAAGARPQKGKSRAIAEWPTKSGPADYVLFRGLTPVAVVEAKRKRKDVAAALEQARRYSVGFEASADVESPGGPWQACRVPFLLATNGRPYVEQWAEASGIWFLDARRSTNHARPLVGWHTPDGFAALLRQDVGLAEQRLKEEPTDSLGLRPYQVRAIAAVEEALAAGQRRVLVAMATGTGKTRTVLGLAYRLLKTDRFRRLLFLVDRKTLGDQAADVFEHERVEGTLRFAEVYDVKRLGDLRPAPETRVHFATVQSMVRRVLGGEDDDPTGALSRPPIDAYDCIVVDECHRGYTLDREQSEREQEHRSFEDYVSKYKRVLEYFDAVKIGLTATPAQHTVEIFGRPVFYYRYREAVIDGVLVDHGPPLRIKTDLSEGGIHFEAGESVVAYHTGRNAVDLVTLPDELDFDVDAFNSRVVTESWNRVVCRELAQHIDPRLDGKTLVFAANDRHADMVVRLLKEAFDEAHGPTDDAAVVKITGASDKPDELLRRFKNERTPSVAVTVDLLTTGVDVPAIVNLVFLRRVKSRILFEQMLGRATRLYPGKDAFRIFDAVDIYAALEDVTTMKPVVADASRTFVQLADELRAAKDEAWRDELRDQLLVKLRRKLQRLTPSARSDVETGLGVKLDDVVEILRQTSSHAARWFEEHASVAAALDRSSEGGRYLYVSPHADRLVDVSHGYGAGGLRPADYLDTFQRFLDENMNRIPALAVCVQRPRELTHAALKELRLALTDAGFTEAYLQSAWRDLKQEDIAATIIGFIRQRAVGDALVPYAERVDRATRKVLAAGAFTPIQRRWLERIAKQLKHEVVVDRARLDEPPFASDGGFKAYDRMFDGKVLDVIGALVDATWREAG